MNSKLAVRARALASAVHRSRAVAERLRFIAREARKQRSVARYTLRGSGQSVIIRHHGLDGWTLEEIFLHRAYAMPRAVVDLLTDTPVRVLDLGGNIGLFALFVTSELGGEGTVFEPDPENARVLKECLHLNGLEKRWRLVEACAMTFDGTVGFDADGSALSHVDPDGGGLTVAACDALPYIAEADLVKMDIEGAEWEILADPRFADARPRAMVIEYHEEFCRLSKPKGAAGRILSDLGYSTEEVEFPRSVSIPEGQGLIWAWRD